MGDIKQQFMEWQSLMDKLLARGLPVGLFRGLVVLGPFAIKEIRALCELSNDEFDSFDKLWESLYLIEEESK